MTKALPLVRSLVFVIVVLIALPSLKLAPFGLSMAMSSGPGSGNEQDKPAGSQEKTAAQQYKNIQVFKDLPASELIGAMQFIAASLGVGCEYCHVTAERGNWPMEKDDKKTKQTARKMVLMMREINAANFEGKLVVNCASCHQGRSQPMPIPPLKGGILVSLKPGPPVSKPPDSLPTTDQVIDNYIRALGGADALAKVKTAVLRGTLQFSNGRAMAVEVSAAAPNKMLWTLTTPNGTIYRGFNGRVGWVKSNEVVRPLTGSDLAQLKRRAEFNEEARFKELYPKRSLLEKETIDGHETYVMEATGVDGVREKMLFDIQSGRLLRRITFAETPLGLLPNQTDFEDYRDVEGIKQPFTVRVTGANNVQTEKFTEIKFNQPIDDTKFDQPVVEKGAAPSK
ncbi:MAG: c-type cytochrome [Acidobacteriia bacterium]|nr:c-type cytochrome [Terriglobia bacterium]